MEWSCLTTSLADLRRARVCTLTEYIELGSFVENPHVTVLKSSVRQRTAEFALRWT